MERFIFGLLAILFLVFLVFAIIISAIEEQDWRGWAADHCVSIGEVAPSTGFGFSSGGNMVTTVIPGKKGYRCDDGKEYWR